MSLDLVFLDETSSKATNGGGDDELSHLYCCNSDVALCGADISDSNDLGDAPFPEDDDVCVDLGELDCERCGE